jgi:cell division protein FtsB
MEKIQEWFIVLCTTLVALSAWIVKKLWGRVDRLEDQLATLNAERITKQDLDKIINVQHLILQTMLSKKKD